MPSLIGLWRAARGLLPTLVAVLVIDGAHAQPAPEIAPEVMACAQDYEAAQVEAKSGHLKAAVEKATSCAQDKCPAYVRGDCLRFVDEYKAQTPSIIVVARDKNGCDTTDAQVSVDGKLLLEKVDGRAIELDPGEHVVSVVAPGVPPEEQRIVATQSQKDRQLSFGDARAPACKKGVVDRPPPPPPVKSERSPMTMAGLVLGGLGLGALATSAGFGIAGFVQRGELEDCKPCSERRIDDVRRTFIIGDVLLANGVALLGTSIALLVVGGKQPDEPAPRSALQLGARASLGGGAIELSTTF
ncbi:MAG: hypothetical protein JNK04_10620 [Myxococcales bacterium]|nr:hypothetical protein [Myxococcales bacterium]